MQDPQTGRAGDTSSNAEPIHFSPKDRPLRRDVGRLGAQLGELLQELAPAGVYETVEASRLAARRRRKGYAGAEAQLRSLLASLSKSETLEVVRAFSAYFGVVNMAEQVHRMRRRMDYLREGAQQPGSLRAVANELARRGTTLQEVLDALESTLIEPVFTAHPTESTRRTLLKKDQRLARALVERFQAPQLDPITLDTLDDRIRLEIASAWQTEEQLPGRPTVGEEVEHVLFFLSDVIYRVVPALHEELEQALSDAYGQEVKVQTPLVRFASWVGGDMDGNPNVDASTIRATLARHLELALRRYREELRGLHEHLSQSSTRVEIDAAIVLRVDDYKARIPDDFAKIPERYSQMPYRQLLWLMSARLTRKGLTNDPHAYGPPSEFRADLELIEASLHKHAGSKAGLALVQRALRRVDAFGFHLAALDVRQDAEVHRRVVGALLDDSDFSSRSATERAQLITAALANSPEDLPRPQLDDPELQAEAERSLDVFKALDEALRCYGPKALGPYIISMAKGPDDALAVLLLARAAGCVERSDSSGQVPLDVAPLFETVDDLDTGPDSLRALCSDPIYAQHLTARHKRQHVMLGYSDSNKDGGIAASRVALYQGQEHLLQAAADMGVQLTLFHGRGGSISRGGSKPRAAILASPPFAYGGRVEVGQLGGHARATEQGEIIGAKFGLRGIASRTMEVMLGALMERTAGGDPTRCASDTQRAMATTLSQASRARYRALVHDDADFPALFKGMTPIDVIERMRIGSRPARRRTMRGVQDLRAIPWVFAWTQCRAVLPGWFGVGSGLGACIETYGLEATRKAVQDWPFLTNFVAELEMVLAKSDLNIASHYAQLAGAVGSRLFPVIQAEHERSVQAVLDLTQSKELLDRDPTLRRSIRLRNPYVDPLSFVQVELLQRWREGEREDNELERVLVQTVRGIARGLKNTG